MNKTNVKNIAKTVALVLLVCAIFAVLFWAMSKLLDVGSDSVIAEYDGIKVYSSDIEDLTNYLVIYQAQDLGQEVNITDMMSQAVQTYVRYKVLEIDLEEDGYKLDESKVKESVEAAKATLEANMGYKAWMEKYYVSKNFLEEDVRRSELAKLYKEVYAVEISELEIKNYYNSHAATTFARPAGYYWSSVIRPVKDITDETESAEAKAEMQTYLDKVLAGTMTLDDVNKEMDAKYNSYPNSVYEGDDVTKTTDIKVYADKAALEAHLAEIDKEYADRDPNAAEDSKQYENYMNYLGKTFQANVYYAIQHMEVGSVWNEVMVSFPGYFIIQLDAYETENDFIPYDEVKDQIKETLKSNQESENLQEYLSEIESYYRVKYYI